MWPWIFVDFDGTLANSLEALFCSYMHFLEKEGIAGSRQEFEQLKGPSIEEIVIYLKHKYQLPQAEQELSLRYAQSVSRAYEAIEPMPGAFELLAAASQKGQRFCLVTVAKEAWVSAFLQKFKLDEYFQHIYCLKPDEKSKPHPDLYLRALKELDIQAQGAIAIEDSPSGLQSATAAGIAVISFGRNAPIKAAMHADSWADLLPILQLE